MPVVPDDDTLPIGEWSRVRNAAPCQTARLGVPRCVVEECPGDEGRADGLELRFARDDEGASYRRLLVARGDAQSRTQYTGIG